MQIYLATPWSPFGAAKEDRVLAWKSTLLGKWASSWDVHDPISGRKQTYPAGWPSSQGTWRGDARKENLPFESAYKNNN